MPPSSALDRVAEGNIIARKKRFGKCSLFLTAKGVLGSIAFGPLTFSPYNGTRVCRPAGVVMNDNDRRGIETDGGPEDFGYPDLGAVQTAFVDLDDIQNPVAGIEHDHTQVFLFQHAHFVLHQPGSVRRAVDRRRFFRYIHRQTFAQFQRRHQRSRRALANARYCGNFGDIGPIQARDTFEALQQFLGDLDLPGAADDSRQQFAQVTGRGVIGNTLGGLLS